MSIKNESEVKNEFAAAISAGDSGTINKMAHYEVRCSKCSSLYTWSKAYGDIINDKGKKIGYAQHCPNCNDAKVSVRTDTPQIQIRVY